MIIIISFLWISSFIFCMVLTRILSCVVFFKSCYPKWSPEMRISWEIGVRFQAGWAGVGSYWKFGAVCVASDKDSKTGLPWSFKLQWSRNVETFLLWYKWESEAAEEQVKFKSSKAKIYDSFNYIPLFSFFPFFFLYIKFVWYALTSKKHNLKLIILLRLVTD